MKLFLSFSVISLNYKLIEEFGDVKEAEIEISYCLVPMFGLLGSFSFSSVDFQSSS